MAQPSIIEIHQRGDVIAVAASGVVGDPAEATTWAAGPLRTVDSEPTALGQFLAELAATGAPSVEARPSAAVNGDWCVTFGVEDIASAVDGLRSVLIVVGQAGAALEYIDAEGNPVTERALEPDDLTDPDRLGLVVLGTLDRAPTQRTHDNG